MPRFRVIIVATGMEIPPDGAIGFATTRFVHTGDAREAATMAVAEVRTVVASEPVFASSPNAEFAVTLVERVRNPLRRSRPNGGFTFIAKGASAADALSVEEPAGAGWFSA